MLLYNLNRYYWIFKRNIGSSLRKRICGYDMLANRIGRILALLVFLIFYINEHLRHLFVERLRRLSYSPYRNLLIEVQVYKPVKISTLNTDQLNSPFN